MDEDNARHYLQQTEEIVWNKYPQKKPKEENLYLVDTKEKDVVMAIYNDNGKFTLAVGYYPALIENTSIIAWAELPEGWIKLIPMEDEGN